MNNSVLLSIFSILLSLFINSNAPPILHNYSTVNGDTVNLHKAKKRYKAIIFINDNSCTGCKEEIAQFIRKNYGYDWWIVTQCNLSPQIRRERQWYFESIFKSSIEGVLFDLNNNENHLNDTRMYRHYNITTTPAVVLIDTKCNTEKIIQYSIIYSDVYISDKFKNLLIDFKTSCSK